MQLLYCTYMYCELFHVYIKLQEVDIGLAADVGTLQRLPKIVGNNRLVIWKMKYISQKVKSDYVVHQYSAQLSVLQSHDRMWK